MVTNDNWQRKQKAYTARFGASNYWEQEHMAYELSLESLESGVIPTVKDLRARNLRAASHHTLRKGIENAMVAYLTTLGLEPLK